MSPNRLSNAVVQKLWQSFRHQSENGVSGWPRNQISKILFIQSVSTYDSQIAPVSCHFWWHTWLDESQNLRKHKGFCSIQMVALCQFLYWLIIIEIIHHSVMHRYLISIHFTSTDNDKGMTWHEQQLSGGRKTNWKREALHSSGSYKRHVLVLAVQLFLSSDKKTLNFLEKFARIVL